MTPAPISYLLLTSKGAQLPVHSAMSSSPWDALCVHKFGLGGVVAPVPPTKSPDPWRTQALLAGSGILPSTQGQARATLGPRAQPWCAGEEGGRGRCWAPRTQSQGAGGRRGCCQALKPSLGRRGWCQAPGTQSWHTGDWRV